MKETAKRFLSIAGSAMTIFLLAGMTVVVFDRDAKTAPALLFDYQSDTPTFVQLFFDVGTGFDGKDTSRQFVSRQSSWREIRLDLPKARIRKLRLDPAETAGTFGIRNLRVVDADGTFRLVIPPAKIRPANQILSMIVHHGELQIQTPPGANDPILEIPLESVIDLRQSRGWGIVFSLAGWTLFWTAVVLVLYYAPRSLESNTIFLALCRKPTAVIWLAAITGTLVSTSPVVFQGKSFISPTVPLFYDRFPTLPNYSDNTTEDCYGADTGAMEWQHFPLTVAQERAIKEFGEFPLWNRYNSAGTTMIGQGQMMLGDALDWVMWLVGVEASTFDIKFVLLRFIFAVALGLAVLVITCAIAPSAMVAIIAPFIGYFIYRVNHPEIFTLCYAPLILLAWLKVIYAEDERSRLRWVVGLMLANWLVINSGTAKEAYMSIAVLNAIGILHFMLEKSRFGGKFKTWSGLLATSGVCFLMIAAPVLGTFFDTLRSGMSNYDSPGVRQYPFWFFLGFVDNFFYLLRTDGYSPAVNALLFVGFLRGIVCTPRLESPKARRSAVVLALGCGTLIAIAFGVIPAKWLLAIPYVNNIRHVDTTFSAILVVPVSILAGIGFASIDLQRKNRVEPIVVSVLIALVFLFVLSFAQSGGLRLKQFTIYLLAVLPAAVCAAWLTIPLLKGKLSFAGIGVCLIAILLVLGRGAMYTDSPDRFVFNPHERISLTYRPELVVRLTPKLREEPTRIVGLGNVLFPGYNATLGLENISGPDGMWNKPYRELTGALKLPYDESLWKIVLNWHDLATYKNALDVLGVGFVLSSAKIGEATSATYVDDDGYVYAYSRRSAWPRAFYTDRIILYDNVQSLAERISTGDGQPFVAVTRRSADTNAVLRQLVDKPAGESGTLVKARDYSLTNNSTSFTIDAPAPGVVYIGETDEPGDFIVTMNGKRVPYLTANHAFKAVLVDGPGKYRVTFRYWPAHLTGYLWLACGGLVLWLAALILFWKYRQREAADTTSPPRELMASLAGTPDDWGSKTPGVTSLARVEINVNHLELIPPAELIREHSGGIDRERFISMGDEIVQHSLIGNAKLLPSHRILDLGCGCGKLARPLTTYLNSEGGYDGIDITREVINWCKERYQNYPNFRFYFADLRNERYNPRGAFNAASYKFPFPNNEFDVVFVGSVFTHMVAEDIDNYIAEIARVMKLGGVCLATYFVLDAVSRENIAAGLTSPKFAYEFKSQTCRVDNPHVPEAAIAYDERFLRDLYGKHDLIIERIVHGEWGRKGLVPHWQDEVWSSKLR